MDERRNPRDGAHPELLASEAAFKRDFNDLFEEIPNQYVAYIDGRRVANAPTLSQLTEIIYVDFTKDQYL